MFTFFKKLRSLKTASKLIKSNLYIDMDNVDDDSKIYAIKDLMDLNSDPTTIFIVQNMYPINKLINPNITDKEAITLFNEVMNWTFDNEIDTLLRSTTQLKKNNENSKKTYKDMLFEILRLNLIKKNYEEEMWEPLPGSDYNETVRKYLWRYWL